MTQANPSVTLTGTLIAYVWPESDRRPARLFVECSGTELVINIWPEDAARGYLTVLGELTQIQGIRFSCAATYVETRGSEVRYKPVEKSWLKVLGEGEAAPSGARPAAAPKAAPRSAPPHDSQRESIERQVAAKGAIELLATKAITPDEFDQWFDHILDKIQGRQSVNTDEAPSQAQPSSVQRI